MREKIKQEALLLQFVSAYPYGLFTGRQQVFKYPPVSPQFVIDIPYIIIVIGLQLVIVGIAAIIITKFFIGSAFYGFAACRTGFRHRLLYHQAG